jgi:acetyl esterase/lipase
MTRKSTVMPATAEQGSILRIMLAIGSLLVLAVVVSPLEAAQDTASEQPSNIMYREVNGQQLSAHVFRPPMRGEGEKFDAVLLFHGGGWNAGTPEWSFDTARRFADWGMVAIAIEYRLSGGDVTPIEAFEDVCESIRWVRNNAADLGLSGRVVGYGVSAGGHLVAASGTVGCPDSEIEGDRSAPDALLLWSPALDVATDGWFARMLQGRVAVSDYSPAERVTRTTPPTSIVIGAEDTLTPLSGARRYCNRLVSLGGVCELNVYERVGHLLTRNLANQEGDFDPDPEAMADGIERHRQFLIELGFISNP